MNGALDSWITLLITDGDIYAFGYNNFGRLGNGNKTNQSTPVKINRSQKFRDCDLSFAQYISCKNRQ